MPPHPGTNPEIMTRIGGLNKFDGAFWAVFLAIAVLRTAIWLAIFEHNYYPRIYRYKADITIVQVGDSELGLNHPAGGFSIWWQSGRRNVRLWPR